MTLIEKIDARFRSGNSVPVERANITASEWAALKELVESELDRARTCVGWDAGRATPEHMMAAEDRTAAALKTITEE